MSPTSPREASLARAQTAPTDTVGMENLSSAAAQGEQASEPHHADGYIFTGTDPSVQTLEDAVRHNPSG